MRDLAAQVTSSLLRFPEVTVDALGEDEVTLDSVLHGRFTVGKIPIRLSSAAKEHWQLYSSPILCSIVDWKLLLPIKINLLYYMSVVEFLL